MKNYLLLRVLILTISIFSFWSLSYSQNVTVNPGAGSYATLKAAFDAINVGTHTGAITIDVVGNTTETAPAVLNASGTGSASYTSILMQPSGGVARTISGAIVAGSPLVDFAGADNVTVNGLNTGGNSLTIENTTVSATTGTSTIRFISGATSNTITNCMVLGSFSASAITNGGNIYFATDGSTTNGNDNNTISSCNVGPSGANLPTKGIYGNGTTTTTGHYNSGNIITDNNIFDFFGAAVTSAGIYVAGGNSDWTISNNRLYQTATRTQTTGAVHSGIQLAGTTVSNCTISGNTVGFANSSGTGTYTFVGASSSSRLYPIYISSHSTSIASNINNNTVSNFAMSGAVSGTSSSASFIGIFLSTGLLNAADNTIGSQSTTGSISFTTSATLTSEVYGIYNFSSSTTTIDGNTIGSFTLNSSSTGSSVFYGIRTNTASGAGVTSAITDNVIGGTVAGSITNSNTNTSSRLIGIFHELSTPTITGNTIRNMTMVAGNTGTTTSAAIIGIAQTATGNSAYTINNNLIHSLSNTHASAAVSVFGIRYTGPTTGTNVIANNIIHSFGISSTSATAEMRGIIIAGGTSAIVNNMIRLGIDEAGGSITNGIVLYGIYDNNTVTTGNGYYYNTSYVGGTGVGGTSNTWAFRSDGVTNTRDWRNNIFHNARSNGSGTGKHFAIQCGGTGVNPAGLTSNRNNLRAPGTGGVTGFYDGADRTNLSAWSSATGQDGNSIEEIPDFMNETGNAASVSLKIDPTTSTNIESGGVNIAGITVDFEGNIRQGNGGYGGTGTAPDIGADEFNGSPLSCTGAPALANTLVSPTPPLCSSTVFTLSLDQTYIAVTYQWQSSPDNSVWSNIGGATFATYMTSTSTTTYYRSIVTCTASAMSTPSNSVQVTVLAFMNGVFTIDNTLPTAGSNYNSFTAAVADLNCRGISGDVTFMVVAGQTFTSADSLNILATGTAADTIAFKRSGAGVNPIVYRSGNTATTNYILRIGGGDYITFDGIDFEQTGSMASDYVEYGVYIQNASVTNGAQHNIFKNCVITLSKNNVASKGVYVHSVFTPTSAAGNNSYNRFLNMSIQSTHEGYRINGATNSFPDISNEINTLPAGTSLIQNLGNGSNAASMYGVFGTYQSEFIVQNTEISDLSNAGTSLSYGIALQVSTANTAIISNNHIHSIVGGGIVNGINMNFGDSATIHNNHIHGLSTTNTSSAVRGMDIGGTNLGANIFNNRIYTLSSSGITGATVVGIETGTGDFFGIYNNMVSDLSAPSSTSTTGGTKGIATAGSTAGQIVKIYYNTIVLSDVGAVAGYTSAGFYNSSSTPVIDFRNNMVINKANVTTGTRVAAYWKNNTTINQHIDTDNNLYYAGTPSAKNLLYYDGTNSAQTITALQAISGMAPRETFSATEDVDFDPIVNGVIRPDPLTGTFVESGGVEIPGLTIDYDGDMRGTYPLGGQSNGGGFAPDIGADEGDFTYLPPPLPDCPTLNSPTNGEMDLCLYNDILLLWTPAITGGTPTGGYDVYFGTAPTPPFVTNTLSTFYIPAGLVANTTYYWKIVPKNGSGEAVGCATYSFTTLNAAVTGTTPGSHCGLGSVTLGASGTGTFRWYAALSGGAPLGTGSSFNTPVIYSTTDFYVSAGESGNPEAIGPPNNGANGVYTLEAGLLFNVVAASMELTGVHIYPIGTGSGIVNIALKNSGGTTLQSIAFPCVGTANGVKTYVPLNWTITTGTDYYLDMTSRSGNVASLIRDVTADIVGGPFATNPYMDLPGIAEITSGRLGPSGTSTSYYFFYDWVINGICESPRQAVTATITPAEPITITPASVSRCLLDPASTLTASSNYAYTTYTWSPASGLNMTTGATVMANPPVSTTYTVTGDDGTCANSATVEVTVNQPPTSPLATANPNPACAGTTVNLFGSGIPLLPYTLNTNCGTSFVDISATGTSIPGALADDSEHNITIPSFTFNGVTYTTARVAVNGVVALGSTSGDVSTANATLPSTANTAGNIFMSPFWDDLDIQTSPTIKTQTIGSIFIIQFTNLAHNNFTTGAITFQIQMNLTTGAITYVYSDVVFGDAVYDNGASATVGLQYNSTNSTQYSFNMANLSNGQCISFTPGSISYEWTGPGGYTSSSQNPVLPAVTASEDGIYTVTLTGDNGCEATANVDLVVNATPAITLGSSPSVCVGVTSADLSYSGATGNPDQYSINYNAAAEAQGFADVNNAALPLSPISLVVPGAAVAGVYNATLTVRVNSTGCVSASYPFTVTILAAPNAGTVSGVPVLCITGTSTFTSNGDTGGTWSSTNPSVADVNSVTGLVTAYAVGSADITYTVSNACGSPSASFATVNVEDNVVVNNSDGGAGSLRDKIACAGNGATITFAPALSGQTITLTSGEILINKNITIVGLGMGNLTISGNDASRIFQVQAGKTLTLEGLALTHGASLSNGGAILVAGQLNLEDIHFEFNTENGLPKALTILPGAIVDVSGNVNLND